ncbi:hypothetical protein Ahy_B06g081340 isoform E [Arachis hypogaea]|uniref:Uncharacterized protein n=1 Tax=Arachis hypogaea TaxID=3818 RepID=A0A444YKS1_ARAHY|nr:hypothetical protein Ahy_B06g081340 isoform E [Arachis hypogaea]
MRSLDLEAMHAPEFPEYVNAVCKGRKSVRPILTLPVTPPDIRQFVKIHYFKAFSNQIYLFVIGKIRGLPGIGAMNGRRIQAQVSNNVSGPSFSLQSTRVALHNALYRCARHADPQLNCMIPPKLRSKGRNFQCTPVPDLSPNTMVPNNNIMWHFTPFIGRPRINATSSNITTHSPTGKWNV